MADLPGHKHPFRALPLDAADSSGVRPYRALGRFDRYTLVLWLHRDVASDLDTQGGKLPSFEVALPDSPQQRSFSTHLHETIHFWQSVGSTTGFLFSLSDSTATCSVVEDLNFAAHKFKPILNTIPADLPSDHRLRQACLTWQDIKYGCAMLDDPVATCESLQDDSSDFSSLGHSLLSLCVNTAARLGEAFDPRYEGLLDPTSWLTAYDQLVSAQRSGFERGGIVQVPLGMRALLEGQARVSEIQHRNFTQRASTWAQVKSEGWLKGIYGRAFEMYLKLAEVSEPESPQDSTVNLFLLLCDIALNPAVGYAEPIDPTREFVHDFHPGIRFMKLCRAILRDKTLVQQCGSPSVRLYESMSSKLCAEFGWKTPQQIARTLLDRWDRSEAGYELAEQQHTRNYGKTDVHRRYLIGEHRSFLETRAQIPHFFCWPAWELLVFDDDLEYAENINQILGFHRPPFTADAEHGVNTVEIQRLSEEERPRFVSNYFATIALYDLCRQWMDQSMEFDWTGFVWKRPLTTTDIDRLKNRFDSTFGVSLDSIHPI
jgi:hypothetical protein